MAGERLGVWRGVIQGLSQAYEVQIVYGRNRPGDLLRYKYAPFPEVTVIDPPISRRADAPDDPIPHIYPTPDGEPPILCLFDPRADGWTRDQSIADTIMAWTASWLRFYEAWHATGVWMGGGASHDPITQPGVEEEVDPDLPAQASEPKDWRPMLLNGPARDVLTTYLLWKDRLQATGGSATATDASIAA